MAKGKNTSSKMTVTGFVEEYEDDDGNYGLLLDASDEDYLIELDKIGKQLRNLVGEEVEVSGSVIQDPDSFKRLKVEQFELLEPDDGDEYGYDDDYKDDYDDRMDYDRDDY